MSDCEGGGGRLVINRKDDRLSTLVGQYERLVYTVCFRMIQDASSAEDLTQETFLSAYLHLDTMPVGYEKQWLMRIAVNKAKDYLGSAYRRRMMFPGDDTMPEGTSPPAEDEAFSQRGAAEIAELIRNMRQPYRPVCELCLLEERSPEEAAAALGRPVKTIHTQLARGKRVLREMIERREDNGPLS